MGDPGQVAAPPGVLFAWDVLPAADGPGACGVSDDAGEAVRRLAEALHDTAGHRGQVRTCRPSASGDGQYVYIGVFACATRVAGSGVVWTTP